MSKEIDNIKPPRGGVRNGAGRKAGTGKFQEPTEVIRIPSSQKPVIADYLDAYSRKQTNATTKRDINKVNEFTLLNRVPVEITLFSSKIPAESSSPADVHVEKRLDPSEFLVGRADSIFCCDSRLVHDRRGVVASWESRHRSQ